MSHAVYNEIDPFACEWLSNLIARGHISPGRIDRRSIKGLDGLNGERPGHFFAGIGAWSYALRLAGVRDDAAIWTGSCPCQPFSGAGARAGFADERHLWPAWFDLIREHRPAIVFGEQVAGPDGRTWLDLVQSDLEGSDYAFAAADLSAAGVGAPHKRQRIYFVAYADAERCEGLCSAWLHDRRQRGIDVAGRSTVLVGDAGVDGDRQHTGKLRRDESEHEERCEKGDYASVDPSSARDPWRGAEWIPCRDGVSRPVEPGTFPLADGSPTRVGRLRAYGNAIVPQVAAAFVESALLAISDRIEDFG